jgi:hypothetical protein
MFWRPNRATTTVVDSFEDSDISEYNGATANVTVADEQNVTVSAQDGSKVLHYTSSNNSGITSDPGEGLNAYPSQGDVFRYWVYDVNDSFSRVGFAAQPGADPSDNEYLIQVWAAGDGVNIYERENDSITSRAGFDTAINSGEWYEVKVTWDDGTLGGNAGDITVELFDSGGTSLGSATANAGDFSQTYTSGGVTWRASDETFFDYMRIV